MKEPNDLSVVIHCSMVKCCKSTTYLGLVLQLGAEVTAGHVRRRSSRLTGQCLSRVDWTSCAGLRRISCEAHCYPWRAPIKKKKKEKLHASLQLYSARVTEIASADRSIQGEAKSQDVCGPRSYVSFRLSYSLCQPGRKHHIPSHLPFESCRRK